MRSLCTCLQIFLWVSYSQATSPRHQASVAATAAALTAVLEIAPDPHSKSLLESQGLLASLLALVDLEGKIGTKEQRLMADLLAREVPRSATFPLVGEADRSLLSVYRRAAGSPEDAAKEPFAVRRAETAAVVETVA